jgi:hypothetical protein
MSEDKDTSALQAKKKRPHHWLIYVSALLAGFLLLSDAVQYGPGIKISARLGVGLVYTAFAFIFVGTRPSSYIGSILLWIAVILTFVV